ncbi:H-type lectin domain-containing protein [Pseudooceanicola nanhaiensis]|uniref:H-type lectin domain-containing protein n=1 Tax=Pseudooceanicola nanhaiensis TaxID=375761 RepID=UPI004058911A
MKKLRNHLIGVDQGEVAIVSDYDDGGEMWTGTGQRERRRHVRFAEAFRSAPAVQCTVAMWDVAGGTNQRGDVAAESVTGEGFELVFRTWSDTRIARLRVRWMAIGELAHADDWSV